MTIAHACFVSYCHAAELPAIVHGHVHCGDFSQFSTASERLSSNQLFVDRVEAIARFIYELKRSCVDDPHDCTTTVMPDAAVAERWRPPSPARAPLPLQEPGR